MAENFKCKTGLKADLNNGLQICRITWKKELSWKRNAAGKQHLTRDIGDINIFWYFFS